jgi:hypothetical protein
MLTATHELVALGARGRARLAAVGWLALWTGLSWSTGFVVVSLQVTYFTLALALLWTLQAERGDRLRRLWPVACGLGLGGLVAAANMLPILLAKAASARGTFTAASQAELGLDWDHALALLWPDLLSWPADRFYPAADVATSFAYATRMPWSQLVLVHAPLRPSDGSALGGARTSGIGIVPMMSCRPGQDPRAIFSDGASPRRLLRTVSPLPFSLGLSWASPCRWRISLASWSSWRPRESSSAAA